MLVTTEDIQRSADAAHAMKFAKLYERDGMQLLVNIRYPDNCDWAERSYQVFYTWCDRGMIRHHHTVFKSRADGDHLKNILERFDAVTEESAFKYIEEVMAGETE